MPDRTSESQRIVDLFSEGVCKLDTDHRVVCANRRATEMLGYRPADVVGRPVSAFVFPEDVPVVGAKFAERAAGRADRYEQRLRRSDGSAIWCLLSSNPVYGPAGRFEGAFVILADITEQKRTEEALRRSEDRYRLISENTADVIWTLDVATMRFTFVSPSVGPLLGWSAEEMIGKPLQEVLTEESLRRAVRELTTHLEAHAAGQPFPSSWSGEFEELRKDGSVVPIEVVTNPLFDDRGNVVEILGVSRDITERRRTEAALRESDFLLRESQRAARIGSYVLDIAPGTWRSSEILDEIFGIGCEYPKTVDGWLALIHPEERAQMADYLREVIAGRRRFNTEYRIVRPRDGEERWVQGLGELTVDANARPIRMAGTIQDVTDRRRQDDERRQLETRLLQAQKLESLGVLAGGVAHEFNNLLTSILGNADLALQDLPADSPARDNMNAIETASRRAAEISRQMLAYSGRGRFVVEPVGLSNLVSGMMRVLEVAVSKKTTLQADLPAGLPLTAADPGQIRQIVMNLVANASEALGDAGGPVRISTSTVDCTPDEPLVDYFGEAAAPGRYVCIEVADAGPGMDAETRSRVFDPFFSTKFAGRGLGLPATLGIVRGHQGCLQLDSAPGHGTTVRVFLPALSEAQAVRPAASEPGVAASAGTVLVVDDEASVRTLAERMIQRCGYRTLGAPDGIEALRLVRERGREIDCVLLDLTMPKMDGEETLRELRAISPDLPVILCSGYHGLETSERFAGFRLAGFLQKPYQLADVKSKLQAALR